jgi:hypothetical protein
MLLTGCACRHVNRMNGRVHIMTQKETRISAELCVISDFGHGVNEICALL